VGKIGGRERARPHLRALPPEDPRFHRLAGDAAEDRELLPVSPDVGLTPAQPPVGHDYMNVRLHGWRAITNVDRIAAASADALARDRA
jgi:hypothetical protein